MLETDVAMQLKATHQKIAQILQYKIDEYDLTFGQLFLMMKINDNPKANQKELAKQMRFTEGAMSSVVKRLINLNMLKQVPLEADLRYNRLVVTDLGKAMIRDYKEYLIKIYQDIFDGFNEEELEKLLSALKKINNNLSKINSNV
ncbi:MAG: MarR family transcriptional regulator [Tissierellia bacterium]|nr:MarR family transcriptional regulator [Tissierellia bacterium]